MDQPASARDLWRHDLQHGIPTASRTGSSELICAAFITPVWPLWSCRVCMPFFLYVPYHAVWNVQFYCIYYNISPIKFFIFGNFTLAIYGACCKRTDTETVEKLRFSDNLCLDYAKHEREKVPVQKLFLSQSIKSQALVLTFYAFALQMLFYARCRAYC